MIRSFRHAGLEKFFRTDSLAGIQPKHAAKLEEQLTLLDSAETLEQLRVPGWYLHPLSGRLKGYWSIRVNGNWRITFRFVGKDVELVDYCDYH